MQVFKITHMLTTIPRFPYLVQHLFASHCCDKLFLASAVIVDEETRTDKQGDGAVKVQLEHEIGLTKPADEVVREEASPSMESIVLSVLDELWPRFEEHLSHMSASHCLRVLLTVLAGEPLPNHKTAFKIRKKDSQAKGEAESGQLSTPLPQVSHVPPSFGMALERLIEAVAGMDTSYLRDLAMHSTGSPCLQLLLRLELSRFGKQRAKDENSIIRKLLPDDPISEESQSGLFIRALMSNPIGSFLLEEVLQLCPGKMFKGIYRDFFKNRLHILVKDEMSGYIVLKVLERLGKDDLDEAIGLIIPEVSQLVKRDRTLIIRTLIERCVYRGVDTTPLALKLQSAYSGPNGFELTRLLKFGHGDRLSTDRKKATSHEDAENVRVKGSESTISTTSYSYSTSMTPSQKLHASLLARTMISIPGILSEMIFGSLVRMGAALALTMARDSAASQVLQAALVSPNASVIFRRKMIQQFYGHVGELALDPSGSHVIDAVWHGTQGLAFIRERIAEELAENEAALRQSVAGRAVWRNWRMVLYRRRRSDWVKMSRDTAGNQRFTSFPDGTGRLGESGGSKRKDHRGGVSGTSRSGSNSKEKEASRKAFVQSLLNERGENRSSIQLARARHAADKAISGGTHQQTPKPTSAAHAS